MRNTSLTFIILVLVGLLLFACQQPLSDESSGLCTTEQSTRWPWYDNYPSSEQPDFSVSTDAVRLHFFGWSLEEDSMITVAFPQNTACYKRAILTYTMGGWNEGPAEWDMTTMIVLKNKSDGKYYELVRAFTPYGGSFEADWEKKFYMDITEYLPMLTGDVEFRIYYGGWDATDKRAHTVQLTFDFFEGDPVKQPVYIANIYDSRSSSNTGYRSWAYGIDSASIEADERMGVRTLQLPSNVKSLLLKVSISGHGHDQGVFLDRTGYSTKNAAEFDSNTYEVIVNNEKKGVGEIFYSNRNTYPQAGTFWYDRANWGPGLPFNVQYWTITDLPEDGRLTIDFNLERFKSEHTALNAEGLAQYIIQVDAFGFEK